MGMIFKAPAFFIYFVSQILGLVICFDLIQESLATAGAVVSLLIFPAVLSLAPLYSGFSLGDWFPVLLVYGGTVASGILFAIGAVIDRDRVVQAETSVNSATKGESRYTGWEVFTPPAG